MVYVLQLSDIHLHRDPARRVGGVLPDERLGAVVVAAHDRMRRIRLAFQSELRSAVPDPAATGGDGRRIHITARRAGLDMPDSTAPSLVLLTGDLAEDGSAAAYGRLRRGLAAFDGTPMVALPGNHDDPEVLAECLPSAWTVSLGAWTVVGADTTIVGEIDGELGARRLGALLASIDAARTRHVLVALHHPPDPGCACDWFQLRDGARLLHELAGRSSVRGVVSGHLHHAFDRVHDGIRLLGAPGALNAYRHGPPTHEPDPTGPTGARILRLDDDGSIATQLVVA